MAQNQRKINLGKIASSAGGEERSAVKALSYRMLAGRLAITLVLFAPQSKPQEIVATDSNDKRVLLVAPCLVFEKLRDESPLDPAKFSGAALGQELSAAGEEYLRSKGFGVLLAASVPPAAATLIETLQPMACRLARGFLTADSRTTLTDLARQEGPALIFAQYLRVRLGGSGYWGPSLSGQIAPGQVETLLAAAFIDPVGGTIVWKNEVLVRKILRPGSKDLEKARSALYKKSGKIQP